MVKKRLRPRWKRGSRVQSLIFDDRQFTASEARTWAAAHGYKASKTDSTYGTVRVRQELPTHFSEGHYATIRLDDGVQAVIAEPKKQYARPGDHGDNPGYKSFGKKENLNKKAPKKASKRKKGPDPLGTAIKWFKRK